MLKAMLFVDADWLCASMLDLDGPLEKPDFQIDYRRMSGVLADEISRRNHTGAIEVVRSFYFASRPEDYDGRDQALVQRRRGFLARLEEEPHVEVDLVDAEFGGRSIGRDDHRTAAAESSLHVALAVTAMRYALLPGVLDLAIFLLGDRSFAPLLRELRRLGKRVALVSIESSCARDLADPANPLRVSDFEVLWLHEVMSRIEKWRGRRPPRPGQDTLQPAEEEPGATLRGRIKNVIWDRGYGFIAAEDGRDYFFHINALEAGLEFDDLQPDLAVSFEVKSGPVRGRAGAARLVRRDWGPGEAPPAPQSEAEAPPPEPPLTYPADDGGAVGAPPHDDTLAPADSDAEEHPS